MTPAWFRTVDAQATNGRWHWWNGRRFGCGIVRAPDTSRRFEAEPRHACVSCHKAWRAWKRLQDWRAAHGE